MAAKIRKLLIQHSKVSPDPARVRLGEFGDSGYVLEVFAFVLAADWGEFLAIKEDLNLRIAEIVRDAGTSVAFPSQTVYFTRDHEWIRVEGDTDLTTPLTSGARCEAAHDVVDSRGRCREEGG